MKFMKGLRHVPYKTALQQLRLFSLIHRRICADQISMVFENSPLSPLSPIQLTQGYAAAPICSTYSVVLPAVANTLSAFGLPRFVVRRDSQRIACEIIQDTSGRYLAVPVPITHFLQPIPSAHMTPLRNLHLHDPFHVPPRLVVYSSPHCSQGH